MLNLISILPRGPADGAPSSPGRWRRLTGRILVVAAVLGALAGCEEIVVITPAPEGYVQQTLTVGDRAFSAVVPAGYELEFLTGELDRPRVLHFAGERLFAGSKSGAVYWLDPPYREANVLVTLDDYPHSVVVRSGNIYVARTGGVYAASYDSAVTRLRPDDFKQVVSLPGGSGHSSRTLKSGPDGQLYVGIGIRGNCSDEYLDPSYEFNRQRGGIVRISMEDEPAQASPYVTGLRNPVGFGWQPGTGDLYVANNGPDHLGYDEPPEHFSLARPGSFHGMPWYQYVDGQVVRDNCVDSRPPRPIADVVTPAAVFPARNAPMDLAFFPPEQYPEFDQDAVVALHGSWATQDDGTETGGPETRRPPKLVRVDFDRGQVVRVVDLVTGFQLPDGQRWGRPMGVAFGPDGALYFSSDGGREGLFRLRRANGS